MLARGCRGGVCGLAWRVAWQAAAPLQRLAEQQAGRCERRSPRQLAGQVPAALRQKQVRAPQPPAVVLGTAPAAAARSAVAGAGCWRHQSLQHAQQGWQRAPLPRFAGAGGEGRRWAAHRVGEPRHCAAPSSAARHCAAGWAAGRAGPTAPALAWERQGELPRRWAAAGRPAGACCAAGLTVFQVHRPRSCRWLSCRCLRDAADQLAAVQLGGGAKQALLPRAWLGGWQPAGQLGTARERAQPLMAAQTCRQEAGVHCWQRPWLPPLSAAKGSRLLVPQAERQALLVAPGRRQQNWVARLLGSPVPERPHKTPPSCGAA